MKFLGSLLLAATSLLSLSHAQGETGNYEDPESGITFNVWPQADITFGMALPADALESNATEFLALLSCTSPGGEGAGWCGISLAGSMVNNLLLMAYPNEGEVLTSFRWATTYGPPEVYTGDAELTQVSSAINSTHYSVIFRCQNCLKWAQGEIEGGPDTSAGFTMLGWAHAEASPTEAGCADTAGVAQHDTQGLLRAQFNEQAAAADYETWAALATSTVPGSCA